MTKDEIIATPEYRTAYFKNLQGKELTEVEKEDTGGVQQCTTCTDGEYHHWKLRDMVPLLNEIDLFRMNGTINVMVEKTPPNATLQPAGSESNGIRCRIDEGHSHWLQHQCFHHHWR